MPLRASGSHTALQRVWQTTRWARGDCAPGNPDHRLPPMSFPSASRSPSTASFRTEDSVGSASSLPPARFVVPDPSTPATPLAMRQALSAEVLTSPKGPVPPRPLDLAPHPGDPLAAVARRGAQAERRATASASSPPSSSTRAAIHALTPPRATSSAADRATGAQAPSRASASSSPGSPGAGMGCLRPSASASM